MRSGVHNGGFLVTVTALLFIGVSGYGAEPSPKRSVQLVTFPETGWSSVKVVRGSLPAKSGEAERPQAEKAEIAEIVTFGDPEHRAVRVMRGETPRAAVPAEQPHRAGVMKLELVNFADPRERPVSILRGFGTKLSEADLFGPASLADLDRVAFAVDGAESAHGIDARMWRPEPGGPQGPMQVTAAAAFDVGGGDRFDIVENRALGRAYLARMYRRYGNWADAVAAYNWGPRNIDAWITTGRATDLLPLEVERYRDRVLRDAAVMLDQ
jgi:hypothetical protein